MDQAAYFRSHPPRCLSGFYAQTVQLPGATFDGHLPQLDVESPPGVTIDASEHINTVFSLACKCGGDSHYVHGYRWRNPDFDNTVVFLSPLALECSNCGAKTALLDTDIHGYDAELDHGTATANGKGDSFVFECGECGRQSLKTYARLEYPGDLFDGDLPEFQGREQDLFTWFSLLGYCPKCSQLIPVADFECG